MSEQTAPEHALAPFDARVGILLDELETALANRRGSILLAIYKSEFVRERAERMMATRMGALGQVVHQYRITGPENADAPMALRHLSAQDRAKTVYFLSGVSHGGGADGRSAYRALNLRREFFSQYRIRAVIWLTEGEANQLPFYALDFWAIRHRVVELTDEAQLAEVTAVAKDARVESNRAMRELRRDAPNKIALREALLKDLPPDALVDVRADLLRTLGRFYHANEEFDKAISSYQRAIELDPNDAYPHIRLGSVFVAQGRLAEAEAAYQRALELDPEDAYPHIGLGSVFGAQGRLVEAEAAYQRALELDPNDVGSHSKLGTVFYAQGRLAEAEAAYQRAIELDPNNLGARFNLGLLRGLQGNEKAARKNWRVGLGRWKNTGIKSELNFVVYSLAAGDERNAFDKMRELLQRGRLPQADVQAVLADARLLARCLPPPKRIEEMIALLETAADNPG